MSHSSTPSLDGSVAARLACAAGATGVAAVLMAALLGLFHASSPPVWLRPTPELMALTHACQQLPGRAQRLRCTQGVVVAHRDRHQQDLRVAEAR